MIRMASEVIQNAEILSQTQNTDAISWRMKIDFLNTGYSQLYDYIHTFGDKYFEKEVIINITAADIVAPNDVMHIKLPWDFFMLQFVGYRNNMNEDVPILRAPNATQFYSGYRLVNDELILRPQDVTGSLVIKYIPQPISLTFPSKYTLVNNIEEMKEGFFNPFYIRTVDEPFVPVTEYMNGSIELIDEAIIKWTDEFGETIDIYEKPDNSIITSIQNADPYLYINLERGPHRRWCEGLRGAYNKFTMDPFYKNGRNNKVEVLGASIDDRTGLGLYFEDGFKDIWYGGFTPDTELNYPANIFFDILTTDVAMQMRRAVHLPVDVLSEQNAQFFNAFSKMLSRDSYMPARINNVYRHRGWF